MKNEVQLKFVQRIKEKIPPHLLLADELSRLLGISKDGAYRRIRGETDFSLEEAALITRKYKISPDSYGMSFDNLVTFGYNRMNGNADGLKEYFSSLLADMQRLSSLSNKKIWFAAEDVPLWHHFAYKDLTAFKMFYWRHSVLNIPLQPQQVFDVADVDPSLIQTAFDLRQAYGSIPSVEIWTKDTINSLLNQIEFYWETEKLGRQGALTICEQAMQMLLDLKQQASKGLKSTGEGYVPAEFSLYFSELMMCNNCAVVDMENSRAVYLTHYNFNSLITQNEEFGLEMEHWMQSRIKTSVLLSHSAEKGRNVFFNRQQAKVEELLKKVRG